MSSLPAYTLYHYWRSSSSWRVRWALAHKKIQYIPFPINLLNGESESDEHLKRNPAGFVPVLEFTDPKSQKLTHLTESLAIIQYLEQVSPSSPLFPKDPIALAHAWALAEIINSGTHPIQNIPVTHRHSSDPAEQKRWNQHWIRNGLETFEKRAAPIAGQFAYGNELTVADLCLMPQIYNAERFEVPYHDLPTISRVVGTCLKTATYQESHPDAFKPAEFA